MAVQPRDLLQGTLLRDHPAGVPAARAGNLRGGLVTEVTLPDTHRWIPKGMRVDYLAVAKTDLVATARCMLPPALADPQTLEVTVEVRDTAGTIVFRALIEMHVSKRRPFVARDSRRS